MELEEIRKQVRASKWKYCREASARCFSSYCNTRLKDYLDYLFPDNEFVYDEVIPKDIQLLRGSDKTRRFRPDARCENLSLIVEFDGIQHYQNFDKALSDISRTEYIESLGYEIVRIPFWIQLSKDFVKYAFDVEVESLCELKYSFFDSGTEDFGLSVSPLSFNALGAIRFKKELEALPLKCRSDVITDLQEVKNHSYVDPMPFSIFGMNLLS